VSLVGVVTAVTSTNVAAVEYNKDYYSDRDVKPTEELFFSLTIVPFSTFSSPNTKQ